MNAAHCWKRSGRRKGYRMYRGMLINKLNVYWGLSEGSCQSLWGTHIPYCSKDTLQKQCWSSACWSAALAATEGKREKIKSLPWIWCVAHNSTFNIHSVQLCLRLSSTLEALKGSFKSIRVLRFVSELQRYLAVQHVTKDRVQTESSVLISCVS